MTQGALFEYSLSTSLAPAFLMLCQCGLYIQYTILPKLLPCISACVSVPVVHKVSKHSHTQSISLQSFMALIVSASHNVTQAREHTVVLLRAKNLIAMGSSATQLWSSGYCRVRQVGWLISC